MKQESVLREIFSGENGRLSSKRIIGTIAMAIAIGCTVYLTVVDRSTETVENLLMTILITSGSLIGAATVTGIWRGNKMTVGGESEPESSQRPKPIPNHMEDPCLKCPYNKKGAQ